MKRFRCAAVLVFGLTALLPSTPIRAQNSNLNAPVSRQPTVGSEIDRGYLAAFDCGIQNVIDVSPFIECVNDLIEANRQKSTLSEPFELGAYLAALGHVSIQEIPIGSDQSFPFWHDRAIKLLTKTKLSIRDFCKAIEQTICDSNKIDRRSFGAFAAAAATHVPNKLPTPAPTPTPAPAAGTSK